MILTIAIFSFVGLAFIVLSFMLGKAARSANRDVLKVYAGLLRVFGAAILIVGNAYAILDEKGWSHTNAQNFKLVTLLVVCFAMVLVGIRFFQTGSAGIAKTSGLVWIVLWLGVTGYGYKLIGDANAGWHEEDKMGILNKVHPYDRYCYLEQIMKLYPNPDDYNKNAEKDEAKINKLMEDNCRACDMGEAEVVDGLPDDF